MIDDMICALVEFKVRGGGGGGGHRHINRLPHCRMGSATRGEHRELWDKGGTSRNWGG